MMKPSIVMLFVAGSAFAQTPQATLDSIQKTYNSLHGWHAVAVRTETISARGLENEIPSVEYELAEKPGGRYRARVKVGDAVSIAVSDGSTTWKALPKEKQWSMMRAAGLDAEQEEPADTSKKQKDLHGMVKNAIFLRYIAIARYGKEPLPVKEDTVKLGKEKRRCTVVRTHIGDTVYDLWVDQGTGLVLQDIQTGQMKENGVPAEARIITRMKLIETNDQVDDSEFSFTPERSWAETEMLVLPGEDRVSLSGLTAANFSAKSLDGERVGLSGLRGKVVVLDFWATWCPPCREELPEIDKLRAEFGDKVLFYGVNDEEAGTVKEYLRKKNIGLATLADQKRTVHRQYGVTAIPTLLVIDRDGVICTHFIGSRSAGKIREAIASALAS